MERYSASFSDSERETMRSLSQKYGVSENMVLRFALRYFGRLVSSSPQLPLLPITNEIIDGIVNDEDVIA